MATRIRLARGGSKKRPVYRVVIADQRAKRDGRYVERIGRYNPLLTENSCVIDKARAEYWLGVGALPSERVTKLFRISGIEVPLALVPRKLRPGGAAGWKETTAIAEPEAAPEKAEPAAAEAVGSENTAAEPEKPAAEA